MGDSAFIDDDFEFRSNHKWKWEVVQRHSDGRTRVVLVLGLPPPEHAGQVDMDLLDCLQQEAKMSICSGPLLLPHCAAGVGDKVDRVWSRCAAGHHGVARAGVAVICWGCGVWHR